MDPDIDRRTSVVIGDAGRTGGATAQALHAKRACVRLADVDVAAIEQIASAVK